MRFFRGDDLRAVGRARTATFLRLTGDATAQTVHARVLATPDRKEVQISSREAQGNVRSQEATATGAVRVQQDTTTGITEQAHLSGHEQRATGSLPVQIDGEGFQIQSARGFVLHTASPGTLALSGPIDSTVRGAP